MAHLSLPVQVALITKCYMRDKAGPLFTIFENLAAAFGPSILALSLARFVKLVLHKPEQPQIEGSLERDCRKFSEDTDQRVVVTGHADCRTDHEDRSSAEKGAISSTLVDSAGEMHGPGSRSTYLDKSTSDPDPLDSFAQCCKRCTMSLTSCRCDSLEQPCRRLEEAIVAAKRCVSEQASSLDKRRASRSRVESGRTAMNRRTQTNCPAPNASVAMHRQIVDTIYTSRLARSHKVW